MRDIGIQPACQITMTYCLGMLDAVERAGEVAVVARQEGGRRAGEVQDSNPRIRRHPRQSLQRNKGWRKEGAGKREKRGSNGHLA